MRSKTITGILSVILIMTALLGGCGSQTPEETTIDKYSSITPTTVTVSTPTTTAVPTNTATPTPIATPLPTLTPTPDPYASWELSEHGKSFLQSMCFYMPDWTDLDALDEDFWALFIFSSFTSPDIIDDNTVSTICGVAEYVIAYREDMKFEEMEVKISHEAVKEYIWLAMGCELPEFKAAIKDLELGRTGFLLDNDYYYIGVSDFGSTGYTFKNCKVCKNADNTYAVVTFDAFEDEMANVTGTITFTIKPAENANGFIITGKESKYY